ncbi:hypothetical protein [Azospirillum halopraeferens]|uniref:hypothetical protein n=1 Tax=Azospirillum halopraeferens TaxID=34010 RepID=UPI0003F9849E|nr:hypothetical protein [Azospirillum halopraeferens]
MTKTLLLAGAALALALSAPPASAQSQGQLEAQQAPVERATPLDTHGTGRAYSPAEKGVGEQHGGPPGDALARPAVPDEEAAMPPADGRAEFGDTTATSALPEEELMGHTDGRAAAEDGSGRIDPGGRTPIRRAGEDVERSWEDAEEQQQ